MLDELAVEFRALGLFVFAIEAPGRVIAGDAVLMGIKAGGDGGQGGAAKRNGCVATRESQ